jgi:hypothetical protein
MRYVMTKVLEQSELPLKFYPDNGTETLAITSKKVQQNGGPVHAIKLHPF